MSELLRAIIEIDRGSGKVTAIFPAVNSDQERERIMVALVRLQEPEGEGVSNADR